MPEEGFDDKHRPTTAGVASVFADGTSTAPTAASVNAAMSANARGVSAGRYARFEENDRAVQQFPFKEFYTSSNPAVPVEYRKENRFEGRSNYQHYYPTGETFE